MAGMTTALTGFASDESGATAIEYGLIAAIIAIGIIASMTAFGNGLTNIFDYVVDKGGTVLEDASLI